MFRSQGQQVGPGREVEQVDGAVGESGGQVAVREGEAAAREDVVFVAVAVVSIVVRGDQREGCVDVPPGEEVAGGAVLEDELVVPRRVVKEAEAAVPDAAGEFPP